MRSPLDTSLRALAGLALLAGVALAAFGCAGGRDRSATPGTTPPPPASSTAARPTIGDTLEAAPSDYAPAPTPAPAAGRPKPGYDRRVDDLRSANASALRGRRIALDPGHGGRFPGSIGVGGLTEAEVNLGVALHLWGLLTDAGAEVYMTRTADSDFEVGSDSSLRADLQERTARANRWNPEAFLSIHHNADPGRRNNVNETQTYYRFDDPVASRELAEAIHVRLKRNLGIEADRILPGNFYVIRNSDAPAVLGESSYLTNPDVEARLALGAKQRLEAEAYFLGLADYFARGVPRVLAARTEVQSGASADDARERPWIVLETDRALDKALLVVDGALVDSNAVSFAPAPGGRGYQARFRPSTPLTDGVHTAQWAVRAKDGGWSKTVRDTMDVQVPVARMAFTADPPREVAPGQVVALTLMALDRHGRPVADTLRATFASRVGAVVVDSLSRRSAAGPGVARAYARVTGGALASLTAHAAPSASWVPPALASQELTLPLVAAGATSAWRTGFARGLDGAPVGGALVSYDTLRATTNGDGFYALPATPSYADSLVSTRAAGYVSAVAAPGAAAAGAGYRLAAIGGGALLGKRIAIDPGGGGADTSGIDLSPDVLAALAASPSAGEAVAAALDTTRALVLDDSLALGAGTPATGDTLARRRAQVIEADANLRVARALREYLEAAGATVLLTRDSPESLTSVDRLRRTEAFRPDRVLVLSHRAPVGNAGVGHYFSSAGGKAWASRMAARLRGRGVVARANVGESASYVVAQTAAVAASANLPDARPLYVERTRGAAKIRDEAYALYLALLEDFGSDAKTWQPVVATVVRGDSVAAGVPVQLDGRWTLFTDAQGRVRFEGLPGSARVALEPQVAGSAGGAPGTASRPTWVTTPTTSEVRLTLAP